MPRLTKRLLDSTQPRASQDFRLWDTDPRGFGVRVKPSGVMTFFVQYRSPVDDKKRRITIGQYGRLTVDEARVGARKLLAAVALGEDPRIIRKSQQAAAQRTALSLSEFCDLYLHDANEGLVTYRGKSKKQSTLAIDAGHIKRHIKPLLGDKMVREITAEEITNFMHAVRLGKTAVREKTGPRGLARVTGGPTTAKRAVDLLGSIFSYAVKKGIRTDNPVATVETPTPQKRTRSLDPDEYRRLGLALEDLENTGTNLTTLLAIRVLLLTGCRRSEIFGLRHDEVDFHRQCLNLSDTKTGAQLRPIGKAALQILKAAPKKAGSPFVFPAGRGEGHLMDVKVFRRAVTIADLQDVTLHSMRHSFASVALELEYSELTIAGLLGHRTHSMTSRYAHHVDRALVSAADRVATRIDHRLRGLEKSDINVVSITAG